MKGIFIMKKYYKFILSLNEYNEIDSQYEIDDENEGIYSSYEEALEKAKKTKIYNKNGQIHRLKTYQSQIQILKKHFKDKKVILDKTQFQSLLKVAPHNCVEQPKATTEK